MLNLALHEKQALLFLSAAILFAGFASFLFRANPRLKESLVLQESLSKLDLNRADAAGLCSVKGIGPAMAERIIAYRRQHGGFLSLEELKKVRGVGEAKYSALKDYFYIKE